MATEDVITRYILDVKDLQNKVKVIETEMRKASGAAKKAGDDATGAFSGIGKSAQSTFENIGRQLVAAFAIERIIAFGVECVKAFQQAELSAKKLQTAVSVSGGLQKDFDKLIQQSKDLQGISIFSDEAIQNAQTAALQFGLTSDEVEKLIPIVADFASATGQDLQSALQGVIQGINGQERALKKYGITLQDGASRVGNLKSISEQLSSTFKDQAEIVGNTVAGSFEKLKNQLDDTQERIGERLAPALIKFKTLLANVADDVANFLFPDSDETKFANAVKVSTDELLKSRSTIEQLDQERILSIGKIAGQQAKMASQSGRVTIAEFERQQAILDSERIYQQALVNVIQTRRELEKPLKQSGISQDDAEDARNKAIEQAKKDKERREAAVKDLTDFEKAQNELALIELAKSEQDKLAIKRDAILAELDLKRIAAGNDADDKEFLRTRNAIIARFDKEASDANIKLFAQQRKDKEDQSEFEKENISAVGEWAKKQFEETKEDYEKQQNQIRDISIEIGETILAGLFEMANRQSEILQEQIERDLQIKNDATDAELAKLEERNQRGVMSDAAYAAQKKVLEDKKAKDELTARTKINALKHQQDLANQRQALFDIAVATARNAIQQPGLFGALIPFWLALGAAQAAVVLAAPLPKYLFKGTDFLQRGNNKSGRDTIPVMANEGEAIIPTDQNKKYPGLAKAWITDDLDRYFLKTYISPALKEQKQKHDQRIIINNKVDVNDFAKKFARELRQLNYQDRGEKVVIVKNLKQSDTFVDKRNR